MYKSHADYFLCLIEFFFLLHARLLRLDLTFRDLFRRKRVQFWVDARACQVPYFFYQVATTSGPDVSISLCFYFCFYVLIVFGLSLNSLEKLYRRVSSLSIDSLGELSSFLRFFLFSDRYSFLFFYIFFEIAHDYVRVVLFILGLGLNPC